MTSSANTVSGETTSAEPTGLRQRFYRASTWAFLGHMSGYVIRLASTLVMTRLLMPEMFGVMALAVVIQTVTSLLSDVGLRQAIMQSPRGEDPALLNTAWTIQVGRGFVIWAVCSAVAGALHLASMRGAFPLGSVYAHPDLVAATIGMGLAAAITGFQSTKLITTDRKLHFGRPIVIELLAHSTGVVVMMVLGWWRPTIWALIAGALTTAMITATLSHTWIQGTGNRFTWHRESARELFAFGGWVLASSLMFTLAMNGDRILLGVWIDASALGMYAIALNLATIVENLSGRIFGGVALAALCEVARDAPSRLRASYWRIRVPMDAILIGTAGFLFAIGPALVDVLYDDRYLGAGPILQVLSFVLIFARYGLNISTYLALGRPSLLAWVHMVKLATVYVAVPLGYALGGAQGAILGFALHGLPMSLLQLVINQRLGLNDWRRELLVLPLWPAGYLLGAAAAWLVGRLFG